MLFILLLCSILLAGTPLTAIPSQAEQSETRESLLRKCKSCRLTLLDREIVEGTLLDIRPDSLEIESYVVLDNRDPFAHKEREYYRQTISFDEISSVRCGDSVVNGIIWGAAIAGIPTMIFVGGATSGNGNVDEPTQGNLRLIASSTAIVGGIGAFLGYLIDRIDNPRFEPDKEELRRAGRE